MPIFITYLQKLITERLQDRNVKCLKNADEVSLKDSNDKLSKLSFVHFQVFHHNL